MPLFDDKVRLPHFLNISGLVLQIIDTTEVFAQPVERETVHFLQVVD